MAEKGRVYFLTDVDKVQVAGPISGGTTIELWRKKFKLPDYEAAAINETVMIHSGLVGVALLGWELFFHGVRWANRDGQESLPILKEVAEDAGYDPVVVASSGRKPHLHQLTEWQLKHLVRAGVIDEWRPNPGYDSASHKTRQGKGFLDKPLELGQTSFVFLLEDDLKAAASFARLHPTRSAALLQANLSNHPRLLEHAGVTLPPNVHRVNSFKHEGVQKVREILYNNQ